MPKDNPLPGEVWSLPNQPSLTTSGEGGQALVVAVEELVVTLYSRTVRRLAIPLRSFELTWSFERTVGLPEQCMVTPCHNPAWFHQHISGHNVPLCFAHLQPGVVAEFLGDEAQNSNGRCPACEAPSRFPGSGATLSNHGYTINSCGRCRRDWVLLYPQQDTPEACVLLAENIRDIVGDMEDRQLVGRVRLGVGAFRMVQQAAGSLGDPPHLAGIPLSLGDLPRGPNTTIIVGYQHADITRGVQRLGGQPDRGTTFTAALPTEVNVSESSDEKPFTNAQKVVKRHPLEPDAGATWWHRKSHQSAHIVEVESNDSGLSVRFRTSGSPEILSLEDFLIYYRKEAPTPPCAVDEEWVDTRGNIVWIDEIEEGAALVHDQQGHRYMLPYAQFKLWKKIERRSAYDRLVDETDDSM